MAADDHLAASVQSYREKLDGPSGLRFWLARVHDALETLNADELPRNYSRLQAKLDAVVVASLGDDVANPWAEDLAEIRSDWGDNVRLRMRWELQTYRIFLEGEIKKCEDVLAELARQSKVVILPQRRTLVIGSRVRAPRRASSCSGRPRAGSSRRVVTSDRAGPDDSDGPSQPPALKLWRHPCYGSTTPSLLRVLLEVAI